MKGNKAFTDDFFNSFGSVFAVGAYLQRKGFNVVVPVPEIRPDESERMKYADNGDLLITMPVQVKHRSLQFTCANDYPFPTIFIDENYKIEKGRKDLFMYVIVARDGNHAAVIRRETRRYWVQKTIYDKRQKRNCTNQACPKEWATFIKLNGGT